MLRIAFQKKVGSEWVNTDLAYDLGKVFDIVKNRMHEGVLSNEKPILNIFGNLKGMKQEWTIEEIEKAYDDAVKFFMEEFKLSTVSLA